MILICLKYFYSKFDAAFLKMVPWIFGALVCVLVVPRVFRWYQVWRALRPLPGPPDLLPFWFLVRSLGTLIRDRVSKKDITSWVFVMIRKLASQYTGQTSKVYVGMTPVVVIDTPKAVETLLTSSVNHRKPFIYDFINSWLGPHNILVATGHAWRSKRKLLEQSFHSSRALEHYVRIFNENGDVLVRNICSIVDRSPNEPIRLFKIVQKCALDIIAEVTMETNLHLQKDKNLKLMTSFNRIMNLTAVRSVSPWVWIQSIYDRTPNGKLFKDDIRQMELITKSVLQEQKYKQEETKSVSVSNSEKDKINSVRNKTLLKNVLLKQHFLSSSYTLDDVRRDIQTIVAAANDTTTTSICWTLSLLGRHPEVQRKVHQELDEIFGGTKDREITAYHLRRMEYLECCLKESLRLYPSFPSVARVLDKELVLDGHRIPKGVMISVDIFSLHRNPTCFEDPKTFIPERFMAEENKTLQPFSYIPFSGGAKSCLGQRFAMIEMKLLLAKVLCKCEIMATTPFEELKIKYEVIIKASGGHPISIRRRTEFNSGDQ
ncbi:unnamed protein product [Ixodes persulcatus]